MNLAPLLAVVLWGGIYPASKLGLQEIAPLPFTALRLVVAAAVLLAVSAGGGARHGPVPRPALLHACLAQTAFQLCLIASLARTTAGNSAILLAASPLLLAVWLAAVKGVRLGARRWAGLLVGFAGVALVVGPGAGADATRLAGDLLALGAAAAWAAYSAAIGPVVAALGPLRATGWTMSAGAAALVPLAVPGLVEVPWGTVGVAAWAGLLYGSTAGMAAAMALWGWSVARLGAARTMPYVYLEPVSAVLLAALVLGESLGWLAGVGGALALAGVWLTERAA